MPNRALITAADVLIEIEHDGTNRDALANAIDGVPSGSHRLTTSTGGEPLADGRLATDHAVAQPAELTLTAWVSNFSGGTRPADAWQELQRLQKTARTVKVTTEWAVYPEMLLINAEAPMARGLKGTLKFREIIRVGVIDNDLRPGTTFGPAAGRSAEVDRGRVDM